MTPLFMKQYLESGARERKDLWNMNPNKLAAVEYLVKYWEDQGHKILVFSDGSRRTRPPSCALNVCRGLRVTECSPLQTKTRCWSTRIGWTGSRSRVMTIP